MRIPREFQGEFLGIFQENSMRTTRKNPRWFQKSYRRIVGKFKMEFQENFRRIPGIIPWDTLVYSGRLPGGFREPSGRVPGGFQEASGRLPDLGRSGKIPGHTLYNFSTCLVPLTTRSTRWWSCPLMITGKSNSLQVLSLWQYWLLSFKSADTKLGRFYP